MIKCNQWVGYPAKGRTVWFAPKAGSQPDLQENLLGV